MRTKRTMLWVVAAAMALAFVVAGCGGGGGGAATNSGRLDFSFGTGGIVTTATASTNNVIYSLATQTDGKIVAAGYSSYLNGNSDFALLRYTTDGSLDPSFGTGGIVTTATGSAYNKINALAIQSDGKIVAAGQSADSYGDFALVRYCANGHLDDGTAIASGGCGGAGFGTGGMVMTAIGSRNDVAQAIAIQPDGKIVTAGYSFDLSSNADFAVVRYCTNGHLDDGTAIAGGGCGGTGFGTGGMVTTATGTGNDFARAVAILSDGNILVAGYSEESSSFNSDFALVRYCGNGHLDDGTAIASGGCGGIGFGTGGKIITAIGTDDDTAYALAIQSDGKIVAAGTSSNGLVYDFALARYNTNGSLDNSFGTGGKVITTIAPGDNVVYALAVQSDGKIVAAGYSYEYVDGGYSFMDFALARYTAGGSLDTSFDMDGKVVSHIGLGDNIARAVAIQTDGRIVAAGYSYASSEIYSDFTVVRYWP